MFICQCIVRSVKRLVSGDLVRCFYAVIDVLLSSFFEFFGRRTLWNTVPGRKFVQVETRVFWFRYLEVETVILMLIYIDRSSYRALKK